VLTGLDFLAEMHNGPRRCSGRNVLQNGLEERLVHLGLVESGKHENDVLANARQISLVTKRIREPIHESVAGQEFTHPEVLQDPLKR